MSKKILPLIFLFHANMVAAQTYGLDDVAGKVQNAPSTYRTAMDPAGIFVGIIQAGFGLVGTIFFLLMLYAGFLWMTARGNEEMVKRAKGILINSVIGITIVVSAYGITYLVFEAFG